MLDNIRQYTLAIPSEQKRYAMNFCKKINYLNELRDTAAQDIQEYICSGYGNVNSRICFVFKNSNHYNAIKPLLQEILDKLHINSWDVYVTFVDKSKKEYSKKYLFLINELHAINPGLLYIFDKDKEMYKDIISYFIVKNIDLPEKYFFIDVQKITSTDTEVRKELWGMFKYLINYKEIEQEE